jgi:hypothetical protein
VEGIEPPTCCTEKSDTKSMDHSSVWAHNLQRVVVRSTAIQYPRLNNDDVTG